VVRPDVQPATGENVSLSLYQVGSGSGSEGTLEFVAELLPHEPMSVLRFGTGRFVLQVQTATTAGITEDQNSVAFELQEYLQPELRPKASIAYGPTATSVFLSHGHGKRVIYGLSFADAVTGVADLELREYITPLQLPTAAVSDKIPVDPESREAVTGAFPQGIIFSTLPGTDEFDFISTADWPHRSQPNFLEVQDGGLYNDEVVLDPLDIEYATANGQGGTGDKLELRFELAGDSSALPVSPVSPVLRSPLSVDPGENAELTYELRAAWFTGARRVSPELNLSFDIDRVPPEAPGVRGVENHAHLDNGVSISFSTTNSADNVLYRVVEDTELLSDPPDVPAEADLTLYDGEELSFGVDPGSYRAISIEAFSRDEAGNVSRESSLMQFVLDRAVVYVDAAASTAPADRRGGRQAPYAELAPAFELAMSDNRPLIQLAAGTYELNQRLSLNATTGAPTAVRIEGLSEQEQPVIQVTSDGGFDIQDLPLSLENLTLAASAELESGILRLSQASSELVMRNLRLQLNGAAQALVVLDGVAQLETTTFVGRALNAGPLVRLLGGETHFSETSFDLGGSESSYRAIEVGAAARLRAQSLSILARPRAGLFTAVHSSGDVDIRDVHFDLSGGQGLIALRSTNGIVGLHSSEFELYGAAEFAYGLFLGATETDASNVHVRVAGSLDDAAMVLERGELSLRDSRLELEIGRASCRERV